MKKKPEDFLIEVAGNDAIPHRQYLNHLFTHYAGSDEWKNVTDEWKDKCILSHRVLTDLLDNVQEWWNDKVPDKQAN